MHLRVMRWKAVRLRVLGQLRQPEGFRVADQLAQQPVSHGQLAYRRPPLVAHTHRYELREPVLLADHTERPVLGVHEDGGLLDDAAQHLRELQLAADGQNRLQETVDPVPGATGCVDAGLEPAQQLVGAQPGGRIAFAHDKQPPGAACGTPSVPPYGRRRQAAPPGSRAPAPPGVTCGIPLRRPDGPHGGTLALRPGAEHRAPGVRLDAYKGRRCATSTGANDDGHTGQYPREGTHPGLRAGRPRGGALRPARPAGLGTGSHGGGRGGDRAAGHRPRAGPAPRCRRARRPAPGRRRDHRLPRTALAPPGPRLPHADLVRRGGGPPRLHHGGGGLLCAEGGQGGRSRGGGTGGRRRAVHAGPGHHGTAHALAACPGADARRGGRPVGRACPSARGRSWT